MKLVILKVGGSVCTEKDRNIPKAKTAVIRRVAREIKKAQRRGKFRIVVVHGAGPFGHKLVAKYGIKNGVKKKSRRQVEGFARTQNSMLRLNKIFMEEFRKEGLLGFPVQASACVVQKRKKISKFDTGIVSELLKFDGVIPIMHGDMVIDSELGASVVSGDAIVSHLAGKLKANVVLMGSNVEGIFTADPKKSRKAKLVGKINARNFAQVLKGVSGSTGVDVTRGMKGKLLEIRKVAKGRKVVVFNLNRKDNLYSLLAGKSGIGTEIRL